MSEHWLRYSVYRRSLSKAAQTDMNQAARRLESAGSVGTTLTLICVSMSFSCSLASARLKSRSTLVMVSSCCTGSLTTTRSLTVTFSLTVYIGTLDGDFGPCRGEERIAACCTKASIEGALM